MAKKKLEIVFIKVTILKTSAYNPRKWDDTKKKQLRESIERFGLIDPLIVNCSTGRKNILIGGHFRLTVAKELGYTKVPVVFVDVPDIEKEKELNLRLNKNTGEWDIDLLKEFDLDLLLDIGFGDEDLSDIWDDSLETEDDNFNIDEEVAKIKTPIVTLGDIYQLGNHKLICGDSTDRDVVQRLVGEKKVSMIYCDPIYNIALDYNKGIGTKGKYGGKTKDKMAKDDYRMFLKSTMENALAVAHNDCHVFYWCDQKYIGLIQEIYQDLNLDSKRVCMWIKNNQNVTPQIAFNKAYEPCVYATRGAPYLSPRITNLNEILNKETTTGNRLPDDIMDLFDIWLVKRLPSAEYQHPTSKPPTLHEKALRRCTKPNDVVLDLFGGSGSTLIACHQMKRVCYMAEIDPVFCEVIIKRYEQLTGTSAKLICNIKNND